MWTELLRGPWRDGGRAAAITEWTLEVHRIVLDIPHGGTAASLWAPSATSSEKISYRPGGTSPVSGTAQYPAIGECAPPRHLPVEGVKIEENDLQDLGLGRKTNSKEQVPELLLFQNQRITRKSYLAKMAEMAELAYSGQAGDGTWGLGMRERAKEDIINAVGLPSSPLYRIRGPIPDVHLGHGEAGGHHHHVGLQGYRENETECQAHHEEARRGDGDYPVAALQEIGPGWSTYRPFILSLFRERLERTSEKGVSDKDTC
jgi:hypothetical protein